MYRLVDVFFCFSEVRYLQERVDTYEKALETIYASGKLDNQVKLAIIAALREVSPFL